MKHVRRDDPDRDAFLELIGAGLRRQRAALGWSQRKLAAEAGVDQSLISRLEHGLAPGIRYERFARILWALGWPISRRESERAGYYELPPRERIL
jgi:transcriptional regulator with XRE-family HTH domain